MIIEVNEGAMLAAAARIHSESWRESHRSFCSAEFIEKHSPEHQLAYLRDELEVGKRLFVLLEPEPVGIVTIWGSLIENLYILPGEQRKGYGVKLLSFAERQCHSRPVLWVLNNNSGAIDFYEKHGYALTGKSNAISDKLSELEMKKLDL